MASGQIDPSVAVTSGLFSVQASLPTLQGGPIGGVLLSGIASSTAVVLTLATAPSVGLSLSFSLSASGATCLFSLSSDFTASVTGATVVGDGAVTSSSF